MIEPTAATRPIHLYLSDLVNAAFDRTRATSVGRIWVRHHPSWVLLRGWFLLAAWAHIYTGSAFSVFPIPNATVLPFEWSFGLLQYPMPLLGLAFLVAATAISWAIAGRARTIGGRVLDAGLTTLVIYEMLAAAINS